MSKRTFHVGLAIVAVALAFLAVDGLCWRPGLTEANVRRIRDGMTLEEVRAILGDCPSMMGHEGHPVFRVYRVTQEDLDYASRQGNGRVVVNWGWFNGNGHVAQVCFRGNRVVQPVSWFGGKGEPPELFARLRAWLGW